MTLNVFSGSKFTAETKCLAFKPNIYICFQNYCPADSGPTNHGCCSLLLMAGLRLLAEGYVSEQQAGSASELQSCHGVPPAELQGSHRLFEVRDTEQQVMSHDSLVQEDRADACIWGFMVASSAGFRGEGFEMSATFDYCNRTWEITVKYIFITQWKALINGCKLNTSSLRTDRWGHYPAHIEALEARRGG